MKLVGLLILFTLSVAGANELLAPGTNAPPFYIQTLTGARSGLKHYIQPKNSTPKPLTLISFWSLSCIPCRKEMPLLEDFQQKHPDQVTVLFVNVDTKSRSAEVQKFVTQYQITSPVFLDIYQTTGKNYTVCIGGACNVPALFGISQTGTILFSQSGYDESHDLISFLTQALTHASTPEKAIVSPASLSHDTFSILHDILTHASVDSLAQKYHTTPAAIDTVINKAVEYFKTRYPAK